VAIEDYVGATNHRSLQRAKRAAEDWEACNTIRWSRSERMFEYFNGKPNKNPRAEPIEEKVTQGVWPRGPTALLAHAKSP
jgi:hypothetical protein